MVVLVIGIVVNNMKLDLTASECFVSYSPAAPFMLISCMVLCTVYHHLIE